MNAQGQGIRIYVREIGPIPSLSPADEVALAERMGRGDPEARARMIQAGFRLVVDIAREYERTGPPLLDLISEGQSALASAVDHFDPGRDFGFRAIAVSRIRRSIERLVDRRGPAARRPVTTDPPATASSSRMNVEVPASAGYKTIRRPLAFHD
jgi:DNA-directed RNA polymerase sigma subunit (sigma70/sigma32)